MLGDAAVIHLLYSAVLFVFGLAAGSFLNVVVYRAPLERSLLNPPSSCPACGGVIAWYDNIPVISWMILGGKCRRCRTPISWRYPAVELLTGVLWAAEGWRLAAYDFGPVRNAAMGVLELYFISALIATIFIDYDWQIILDEISLGGTGIAVAASAFLPELHAAETPAAFYHRNYELYSLVGHLPAWLRGLSASALGAVFGAALVLVLYFLGGIAMRKQIEKARREDPEIDSVFGLGDVKLMACMGAFLGWRGALLLFMLGVFLAAVAGSILKLASGDAGGKPGIAGLTERWRTGQSVLPFGPFLAVGAFVILFARYGAGPPP
ncbi:MAG: prepilin peptidase [Planctomycetota bacterium]|jgi:leader peptidase (prepilin peptidase)/N-methyltransferase|nr:prepilin peptidase [Planctomycetota bacterium]